jgi:hypothetical protein
MRHSFERCRAEAVIPPPSGDKGKAGNHEQCGLGGWPGPHFYLRSIVSPELGWDYFDFVALPSITFVQVLPSCDIS